jgi:hypothetical protein
MRNVSDKICGENHNTYSMFNNFVLLNQVDYEMWKNIVQPGRRQMTVWRMRIAL